MVSVVSSNPTGGNLCYLRKPRIELKTPMSTWHYKDVTHSLDPPIISTLTTHNPHPRVYFSNGDHGTTDVINYLQHYITRIPSRESDDSDYEAPVSIDQMPVYQEIQYIMKTSMMMLKKPKLRHSLPRFWASIHPVHHG